MGHIKKTQIVGDKLHVYTEGYEEIIDLLGAIGDPVIAIYDEVPPFHKCTFKLPNGENIRCPYLVGKITDISTQNYDNRNPMYTVSATLDMENGDFCSMEIKAKRNPGIRCGWRLVPFCDHKINRISDYRAYAKYEEEFDRAYAAFMDEWSARNPLIIHGGDDE